MIFARLKCLCAFSCGIKKTVAYFMGILTMRLLWKWIIHFIWSCNKLITMFGIWCSVFECTHVHMNIKCKCDCMVAIVHSRSISVSPFLTSPLIHTYRKQSAIIRTTRVLLFIPLCRFYKWQCHTNKILICYNHYGPKSITEHNKLAFVLAR